MSRISEQKALEAYPIKIDRIYYGLPLLNGAEPFTDDVNIQQRNAYIQGYDQAFQDFMEKAERYLQNTLYGRVEIEVYGTLIPDIICKKGFIENFKNYMKKEA